MRAPSPLRRITGQPTNRLPEIIRHRDLLPGASDLVGGIVSLPPAVAASLRVFEPPVRNQLTIPESSLISGFRAFGPLPGSDFRRALLWDGGLHGCGSPAGANSRHHAPAGERSSPGTCSDAWS